jgi:type II secretory pathway component GspD/PulD (secretin)
MGRKHENLTDEQKKIKKQEYNNKYYNTKGRIKSSQNHIHKSGPINITSDEKYCYLVIDINNEHVENIKQYVSKLF